MDDLISRQAVIEIIQSMYPGMPRVPWMRKDWQKRYEPYIQTENAIRKLSSAQPEIIRCKDCKHRILNENYGKKGNYCMKAICELDTGDPFELGRMAENDNWYCADAERRKE